MTKQEVLQKCTVESNVIKLPDVALDRKVYLEVKKSFELIGGKWKGGKIYGFLFNSNPTDLLAQIANGEKRNLKKEFQFFATPKALAEKMTRLAELKPTDDVLEPEAGQGAIVAAINSYGNSPDCYELMDVNVDILKKSDLNFIFVGHDFLKADGNKLYDKIIANPPFTKNQDIQHIYKMFDLLKPKGRIVTLSSQGWVQKEQKVCKEFRSWLKQRKAIVQTIPRGTFKESGTMVGAELIIIDKP